jgi:DivIVA domain-containing protein
MAAVRLDHPLLMSAEQVRRREFVTVRRGYDPDQVRHYLVELAEQIDVMASMIREARMETEAAIRAGSQPQVDPYERLAERVASVIREADQAAERLRLEGRRDAERVLGEARDDADRMRTEAEAVAEHARAESERALNEARERADRTVAGLASRRQAVVDQLAEMQERLLGVARELEEAIDLPTESPPEATADDAADDPDAAAGAAEVADVVDVRDEIVPPAPPSRSRGSRPPDDTAGDPSYEDLWDGTEAIRLEVPDIPPLDLSWDAEGDEGANGSA